MAFKHFPDYELRCKCGCGKGSEMMDEDFMRKLIAMRDAIEKDIPTAKFPLSSAYRCPEYNSVKSKTGATGPHTTGQAVDIKAFGKVAHWIAAHAAQFGITGVGVKQKGPHHMRFVHVDDLTEPKHSPRPWLWSY